jgi:hypothetical protein
VRAPIAAASDNSPPTVTFALLRTAEHASFTLTMQIQQVHKGDVLFSGAVAAVLDKRRRFSHLTGLGQSSAGAPGGGPRLWMNGRPAGPCLSVLDCPHGLVALGFGIDDSDESLYNRIYIPVRGRVSDLSFHATGWQLLRTPYPFRTVDGISSSSEAVSDDPYGVEVFEAASAPGGRHGSIAMGDPPCSTATSDVLARGVGTVTLAGGRHPSSLTCPTDTGELVDITMRPTRWTLKGTVAGDTTQRNTRLLVLDLPLP